MSEDYKMIVKLEGVDKTAVQRAMFALGYGWGEERGQYLRWEDCNDFAYVVDSSDTIWRIVCEEFCNDSYKCVKEYILVGNKLVEKQIHEEEKPPLGLRPRWIASSDRLTEILEAMQRYVDANKQIPAEWIEEMREVEHLTELPNALAADWIDPTHPTEGIIVRVDTGKMNPYFLKSKNYFFKCMEGLTEAVDAEDAA